MGRDVRTPEQKAAVVKCRFCPWERPRFRQYDGEERQDVMGALAWHVQRDHPEQAVLLNRVRGGYREGLRKQRDAYQVAHGNSRRRIG